MPQAAGVWVRSWAVSWLVASSCTEIDRKPLPVDHAPLHADAVRDAALPDPPRPLRILLRGCLHAGAGARCALGPSRRRLVLWAEVLRPRDVVVTIDGVPVTHAPEAAVDGWRWTVEVPAGARRLRVEPSPGVEGWAGTTVELLTRVHPRAAELRALARSMADEPVAVRRALEAGLDRWTGSDLVYALGLAGQLAREAGDEDAFFALFERGVREAEATEQWNEAGRMAQVMAFTCIESSRDFDCARRWLARDAAIRAFEDPNHWLCRGLLAERRGDFSQALAHYRRSVHDARALGFSSLVELAPLSRAMLVEARLGNHSAALTSLRMGLPLVGAQSASVQAQFFDSAAWALLLLEPRGSFSRSLPPELDPTRLLLRAMALLGDRPASDERWAIVRLNLAYDALDRVVPTEARRWLSALEPDVLSRELRRWHRFLRARLARLEGRLGAAGRMLRGMLDDAGLDTEHGLQWSAHIEFGQVLESLGDPDGALLEYARADRTIERQLDLLGVGRRDRFMMQRGRSTQRQLALLSARGDDARALCVARIARTRVLRALQSRLRRDADPERRRGFDQFLGARLRLDADYDETFWEADAGRAERRRHEIERAQQLNQRRFDELLRSMGEAPRRQPECESLSRPPVGTLDLHYVRGEDGWTGFSMDDAGVVLRRPLGPLLIPPDDPPWSRDTALALGEALLGPFASQLATVERIRVMPTADLYRVPMHALHLGPDAPVRLEELTVVYGLDLPRPGESSAPDGPAVVLAPPSGLVHARREAEHVARVLRDRGAVVQLLTDASAELSSPAKMSEHAVGALPTASWFHYVGHARADGASGWGSELLMAGDQTISLGVADILALPSSPAVVVLNGCETGVADPRSWGGGMSLAHAFVLAGAQVVVATAREIRDDRAAELMLQLYGELSELSAEQVPASLRRAQRRAVAEGASIEAWRLVRAWVP